MLNWQNFLNLLSLDQTKITSYTLVMLVDILDLGLIQQMMEMREVIVSCMSFLNLDKFQRILLHTTSLSTKMLQVNLTHIFNSEASQIEWQKTLYGWSHGIGNITNPQFQCLILVQNPIMQHQIRCMHSLNSTHQQSSTQK